MQRLNVTEVASGYILDLSKEQADYLAHIYKCIGVKLGYAIVDRYTPTQRATSLYSIHEQREFHVEVMVGSPDEYAEALKQARGAGYSAGFAEGKAAAIATARKRLQSRQDYLFKDI